MARVTADDCLDKIGGSSRFELVMHAAKLARDIERTSIAMEGRDKPAVDACQRIAQSGLSPAVDLPREEDKDFSFMHDAELDAGNHSLFIDDTEE